MPINLYRKLWNKKISPINLHLKSYSNTKIDVIGKREVFVAEANKTLPLIITEANRPVLLGTTWIKCLPAKFLKFSDINLVHETTCSTLVNKFAEVFGTSNVGVIKDHNAHLILRKDANPRFFRARNVPYVMRNAIEKELGNLEAQGVITKIERSDWATPIVPIMKKNGHVRICGDFKITLNPVLKIDQYPLPKIEDIFAILGRGINFSKIDLSQAYLKLELDENSKEMAVINTHKGLYRYNRLPFESEADHLRNLEAVLNRLNEYGLKANREKCNFFQESLEYCGHVIDKMGLHKTNDKIRAVLDAPEPINVTQLRAFLGLITYYHKFIRNAADVLSPLYALLKKGTKWHFSTECRTAFRRIKEIISSDQILIAYDPKLPIRLSCDSSSYGLGAVLSQIDVDGNERPIYFISRTLSQAEKKYSQIDKECLSIIWALKKFNNYLFGRKFELITDNKPLHHILNPKREISSNMSARLQRWALILSSYNFTIECRKTGDHGNADGLSRLPLKQYEEMEEDAVNTVHMIKQCEELPLTSSHIRRESCKDSILKIVYQNTLYGWKDKPSNTELLSFYLRREELSVEQGVLLLGTRVVIPRKFRAKIKAELHQGHLGVVKMKALARKFIWWPGIDREIEEITRVCRECNINNHTLKQESVHRWESAPTPWYRVHLDFAGPFMNRMFLIVIDSYSKWPEVIIMNSTTAGNTIRVLRDLFSRYGIPDQVVTDNDPQFVSEEMKYFFKSNGVHHLRSAPYFPATNGLAERFVQTLKRGLKNMRNEELNKSLANFLFTYRTVPHSSTREAPAVLFLKRMLKCKWNLLKPKLEVKPGFKKGYSPDFEEDEDILVRDFLGPNKWKEGKIIKRLGKCFYTVKLNDGRLWRRHVCQLRKSYIASSPASEIFLPEQLINYPRNESRAEDGSVEIPVSPSKYNIPSSSGISAPEEPGSAASASDQDRTPQRRYPMRDRRPPERFEQFSNEMQETANNLNLPTGGDYTNFARSHDFTTKTPSIGAVNVHTNWADLQEDDDPGIGDGHTVVQSKKRRRDTRASGVTEALESPELFGDSDRRVVGGARNIIQLTRMNGHVLFGKITIGNLPFYVEDAVVIDALSPYGRVTSITPKQLKVGEYGYTKGRREAYILLHDGMKLEKLPTRLVIKTKGDTWPAFLTFGIRCSKCHNQGHRRANCPMLARQSTGLRQASPPSHTDVNSPTAPQLPRQLSPTPPAPAPPTPSMKVPSDGPTGHTSPGRLNSPQPAEPALQTPHEEESAPAAVAPPLLLTASTTHELQTTPTPTDDIDALYLKL
ncbi:K02A2.6-like [Cordylochernes scorpioides]|uniref:RNA-directed DNA polymerase n=1 Tax=Cordylochernes scorpioides TaxID=51811 RepID=A0ABY6K4J0_9ARAC|nr:K02A2.6-like [Cordylochernes scorpioides]